MSTVSFLSGVIDLAVEDSLDELLAAAVRLVQHHGAATYVELWDIQGRRFGRGEVSLRDRAHCVWIGISHTIGAIYFDASTGVTRDLELLARQLAPLAERLFIAEASRKLTIREEIAQLYERRVRDALLRADWNASAVARELHVGRARVIQIARRWKKRTRTVPAQNI